MSLRDAILGHVEDRKSDISPVATPEWSEVDGQLGVSKLSSDEADAWEFSLFREVEGKLRRDMRSMRAKLVVRCLVDRSTGERVFGDGDVKKVGDLPSDVAQRIFEAARKHNGLVETAVEDESGNSDDDQSD